MRAAHLEEVRDSQKDDDRRIALWTRVLGPNKDVSTISLAEWELFIDHRRSGAINARGEPVVEADRRPVSIRTVESNLRCLKAVLTWATRWRSPDGQYLLRDNPVRA